MTSARRDIYTGSYYIDINILNWIGERIGYESGSVCKHMSEHLREIQ